MTTTVKVLIQSKLAEGSETMQYASKDCKTAIDKFTATNLGDENATITVHLVPAASAPDTANGIVKTLAPGATWPFPEIVGHNMESGDFISTISGTPGAIWIRASGRQFT